MVLFNGCHATELCCQLGEALFFGCFGKGLIHIRPLKVLTVSCSGKIFRRGTDAVELFEPQFGMFLFILSCFQEKGCNLLVAFLLGLGRKIGIFVSGLGLTGKSGFQILLGLCACIGIGFHRCYLHLKIKAFYHFGRVLSISRKSFSCRKSEPIL